MAEPIQKTVDVLGSAAQVIISQGVLGALVIVELAVILLLGWLLWKTRDKYTDHLEDHYDNVKD